MELTLDYEKNGIKWKVNETVAHTTLKPDCPVQYWKLDMFSTHPLQPSPLAEEYQPFSKCGGQIKADFTYSQPS